MADQNPFPPNLPVVEDKKPISATPPPFPVLTPRPVPPLITPPIKPPVQLPVSVPSTSVAPKDSSAPVVTRNLKSFIRTMETDIQAVQSGKSPQGVEKQIPAALTRPSSPAMAIQKSLSPVGVPPVSGVQIKLGKIEPSTVNLPDKGGLKISVNAPQATPKVTLPVPRPNTVVVPPAPGAPKLPVLPPPPPPAPQPLPATKPSLAPPAPLVLTPIPPKPPIVPSAPKPEIKVPVLQAGPGQRPPSLMPSSITPPESGKGLWFKNPRNIIAAVVVLAVLGFGYWFLVVRNNGGGTIETPAPTVSSVPTPTARVSRLKSFFGNVYNLSLPSGGDVDRTFIDNEIFKLNLDGANRNTLLNPVDEYGIDYTFGGFLDRFLASFPVNLLSGVDQNDFDLVLSKQQEKFDAKGQLTISDNDNRLALVVRVTDAEQVRSMMLNWEESISAEMRIPLAISSESKQPAFTGANYRDVTIRYRNFPYPDHSIDYAVVTAVDNDDYLIISSSREQMFAIVDILLGFGALGK